MPPARIKVILSTAVCGSQIVGRRVRMQSRKLPEWLVA